MIKWLHMKTENEVAAHTQKHHTNDTLQICSKTFLVIRWKCSILKCTLVPISEDFSLKRRINQYNITGSDLSELLCFFVFFSLCVTSEPSQSGCASIACVLWLKRCRTLKHQDFSFESLSLSFFFKIPAMMCLGLGLGALSLRGYMTFLVTSSNMFFT